MNKLFWLWSLLLVIGLPVFTGPAWGQSASSEHKSHRAIPLPRDMPSDPDKLWQDRFGEAQINPLVQQILQNKELVKQIRGMVEESQKSGAPPSLDGVKDEKLRGLIQQWSEQGKIRLPGMDQDLRPEQLEAVKKKLEEKLPLDSKGPDPADFNPTTRSGSPSSPSTANSRGPGPSETRTDPSSALPPPPASQPEGLNEDWPQRLLRQLAERIPEMDPEFAKSPAFQRVLRKLSRGSMNQESDWPRWNALGERWNKLPEWVRSPSAGIFRTDRGWPFAKSISAPSWGRVNLPSKLFSRSARAFPGASPGGSARGGDDSWSWLLMTVLALLGGLVAWKMIRLHQEQGTRRAADWRLGPWPVDPATVSTREQLVQAFEYLSMLRLGPAARHQNHHQIAEALGKEEVDSWAPRHQAAEHLAAVYEQARYAPTGDLLPEEDLAAARREICLLAGVSGA